MASRAHGWEIRAVSLIAAPPPRTGEAAQGPWSAAPRSRPASDHAEPEPLTAGPPTLPKPVATARTVATGLLFATAALVLAGAVLGTIAAFRLLISGHARLQFGDVATGLMAVSFAVTYVGLLVALTRSWAALRPSTLIVAVAGSLAWPQSGVPRPAALRVTIAVGLSVGRDRRTTGGRRLGGIGPLAVLSTLALALVIAGMAAAETNSPRQATGAKLAPADMAADGTADRASGGGLPGPIGATGTGSPTGSDSRTRTQGETESDGATAAGTTGTTGTPGATVTHAADGTPSAGGGTDGEAGLDAPGGAAEFVAAYYLALDERRFDAAWASLSPAVRASFGGFDHWRNGYGRTLSSTPREVEVTDPSAGAVTVKHVLVARDKGCATAQRFAVTWNLRQVEGRWRVDALRASTLGPRRCR